MQPMVNYLKTAADYWAKIIAGPVGVEKLLEMLDSFETVTALYEQFQVLPTDVLVKIAKKGDAIRKLLSLSSDS